MFLRTIFIVIVLLATSAVAACGSANSTPLPPLKINIIARDDKFEPNLLTGKVNQPIELTIENQGTKPHSFVIDELQIKIPALEPGKTGSATFTGKQIRTYTNGGAFIFYSDVAGDKDAGLTGNLSINP